MPKRTDLHKILIIGSGPIIIGQACEFDYSGTQACKALRNLGYKIVLVNSNPATIMTDPEMADATYIEPLNVDSLTRIIARERPDAVLPNLGGQTGLNLTSGLAQAGVLEKYGVEVIGVKLDAIERGENRTAFKESMTRLGIEMPTSEAAYNVEQAEDIAMRLGFPVVIRPAYTMGGTGGGLVYNLEELRTVARRGIAASIAGQILVEEFLLGWEELELEIVRDAKNQMITVCFIENVDPMGVHTGDSICTAPMQTISHELQERLRKHAYDIVEAVGVIGGTNIQFAHDPKTGRMMVIEINPRASRSSALASKATGFPIAYVSALLACGLTLDEIPYWREQTLEKYTPHGDYVVVKFPRWDFEKFPGAQDLLGTQMRAVGEVMGIGRTYKEALQKTVSSMEQGRFGLGFAQDFHRKSTEELLDLLYSPSSDRLFVIYEALRKGVTVDVLHHKTSIKPWFIQQIKELVDLEERILACRQRTIPDELLIQAKCDGFADQYLAKLIDLPEQEIRKQRQGLGLNHAWEPVPVSGVAEAKAYYYSTYCSTKRVPMMGGRKIMVLGGGPNRIGQGIEFDYCCVHAALAIREAGLQSILINCNPETVSTDYDTSNRLYFEPLTVEDVLSVYEKEWPEGVIVQFGGQTPLNIVADLAKAGVRILGTSPETIDLAEDRSRFYRLMDRLDIPMPESGMAVTLEDALAVAERIGYPLIVRPSYVLGGRGMEVVHDGEMLEAYLKAAVDVSPNRPVLIDRFLENAIEAEVDTIADGTDAFVPSIMELIELVGVHSGDSACVIPAVSIAPEHLETIREYTRRIAVACNVVGLINIQYAVAAGKVYVLEANPRASRTVPLVSKVCGIPMARLATRIMLGEKLSDLNLSERRPGHFGVKEAVFSFNMFPEVDPVLGPEMRSTGEVLGLADSFGMAFCKSQMAAGQNMPEEGGVLISANDRDKDAIQDVVRGFQKLGYRIIATQGTRDFLERQGIQAEPVLKMHEGRPNNSYIRKAAIQYRIPYITTVAAAAATVKGIAAARQGAGEVRSLQDYNKG